MSAVEYYGKLAVRLVDAKQRAVSKPVVECIRLVAHDLRTSHGSIWTLLYRHPKQVRPELRRALHEAVVKQLEQEIASLEHEHRAVSDWITFSHPGELEAVQADIAALKERLAKMRGAA
jgi:hypothetical protein